LRVSASAASRSVAVARCLDWYWRRAWRRRRLQRHIDQPADDLAGPDEIDAQAMEKCERERQLNRDDPG